MKITSTKVLAGLLLIALIFLAIFYTGWRNRGVTIADMKGNHQSDSIKYTKTISGLYQANVKQQDDDRDAMNSALDDVASYKAQLADMKIKAKNVTDFTVASTKTSASGSKKIPDIVTTDSATGKKDSSKAIPCYFKPFLFADGDKFDSLYQKVSRDSIKWHILHFDYLTFVQHTVRPVLKRNYVETSVVAEDPNTKITGLTSLHYVEDKKWFQTNGFKYGAGGLIALVGAHLLGIKP